MDGFFRAFGYAARGIATAVKEERNLRFHLCAAVYMYVFSLFYGFTPGEYALLTALVGGVLALELVNSGVERIVDKMCPERDRLAGTIKDMAAGAVLVFSVAAAVCGVLLFGRPAVLREIGVFFANGLHWAACLAASLVGSWFFIFWPGRKARRNKAGEETE